MAGLDDEPRPGRPKIVDNASTVAATLEPPPEALAVTHWSSRLLGRQLGVGDATVARAWRKYHLQPLFAALAYPRCELRVVLDNYRSHKHAEVNAWLNLVEVFFGIITRQAIRRESFDNVKELVAAIRGFIDGWNTRCHPFTWTKTADEILPHVTRQRTSDARH